MFYVIGSDTRLRVDFVYDDSDNTIQAVDYSYRSLGLYSMSNIMKNSKCSLDKYKLLYDFSDTRNGVSVKGLYSFYCCNKDSDGFYRVDVYLVLRKIDSTSRIDIDKAVRYINAYYGEYGYPTDWVAGIKFDSYSLEAKYLDDEPGIYFDALSIVIPPDMIEYIMSLYNNKDYNGLSVAFGGLLDRDFKKCIRKDKRDKIEFRNFYKWL